jgi:hypothetical protein
MIWLLFLLAMMVGGILLMRADDDRGVIVIGFIGAVFAVAGGILLALFMVITVGLTCQTLELNEENQRIGVDVIVLQDRYEAQKVVIENAIVKFPLEQDVLKSFNPTILLSLPEIKSDTVISKQLELLLTIQDDIYTRRLRRNEVNMTLRVYAHRWFVPTLVKPKIEKQ